jgi:hypothetical protein
MSLSINNREMFSDECPACSNRRGNKADSRFVYTCKACGGIFSTSGILYLGDSYSYVLPRFETAEVPAEQTRYFDFLCLGSKGLERRHGWFNPATKLITQVG